MSDPQRLILLGKREEKLEQIKRLEVEIEEALRSIASEAYTYDSFENLRAGTLVVMAQGIQEKQNEYRGLRDDVRKLNESLGKAREDFN